MNNPILQVEGLKKFYQKKESWLDRLFKHSTEKLYAVNDVSFTLHEGETLGLVGESGCGKSTLCRTLLHLYEPSAGKIVFHNQEITGLDKRSLSGFRREMQMIFQDPYSSLNPKMTVRQMLAEAVYYHKICATEKETEEYIAYLLERVGLNPNDGDKYPKAFSGGQRQRIAIARAIAVKPKLLIADEPVSALDVSVQAHILNLLRDLQKEMRLSMIFISHDLSVVKYISDRVAVMYLGRIVEIGNTQDLFTQTKHPYTKALLSAVPRMEKGKREKIFLDGDPPSPFELTEGCHFYSRCPLRMDICQKQTPALMNNTPSHRVACHLLKET